MGITPYAYYSSEVDPYPIKLSSANFPDIVHIGSVEDVKYFEDTGTLCYGNGIDAQHTGEIDLLIGGPPCTNLSIAGKRQGLWAETLEEYFALKRRYERAKNGNTDNEEQDKVDWLTKFFEETQSHLFWEAIRILREAKPRAFFIENVSSMHDDMRDVMTRALFGIEPMYIDSHLTSAQTRKRYYWMGVRQEDGTYKGIDCPQPEDAGILLKDILEDIPFDAVDAKWKRVWQPLPEKYLGIVQDRIAKWSMTLCNVHPSGKWMNGNVTSIEGKLGTLTTNKGEGPKILCAKKAHCISAEYQKVGHGCEFKPRRSIVLGRLQIPHGNNTGWLYPLEKICAINANGDFPNNNKLVAENEAQYYWRKLTVRECARAQSFSEQYSFDSVSPSRAYKAIGNSWERLAIEHQFHYLLPYIM